MRLPAFMLVVTASALLVGCGSTPPARDAAAGTKGSIRTARGGPPKAYAPPSGFPRFVDQSVGTEEISIQAMSLVGVPYRWGGNTPEAGFDCSGLVRYVVARAAEVELPRTTADMSQTGSPIDPDGVAPGDLIYFNTTGRPHSHVGIYVGNYRFVNAPSTGGTVRIDYVTNPYWAKRFDGLRRIERATQSPFDAPQWQAAAPPPTIRTTVAAPRQAPAAATAPAPRTVAAVTGPGVRGGITTANDAAGGTSGAQQHAQALGSVDAIDPIAGAIALAEAGPAAGTTGDTPAPARAAAVAPAPHGQAVALASSAQARPGANGGVSPAMTVRPAAQPGLAASPTASRDTGSRPPTALAAPGAPPTAADAFEPPPPLARQAMRQAPATHTLDARAPADDDPIARMAAGQL